MEEKSEIEILKEFAKSTNRSIVTSEMPYPLTGPGVRSFPKFKRTVHISNNKEKTSFFICFSDPFYKVGQSTVYSGAFIPLSSKINSKVNFRKRDILDKLNIFSKTKANRIGSYHFDSKILISGHVDSELKRILTRSRVQKQIINALEIESYIAVSINEYIIDFVPELKNTSHLSILNQLEWDVDKNKIEKYFTQIEKIRDAINNNYT